MSAATLEPSALAALATRVRDMIGTTLAASGMPWPERLQRVRQLNRQLQLIEIQHGATRLTSQPATLELPVAGKCNLRCTMCSLSFDGPKFPNWSLAEVKRFEPFFPFAQRINPTGAGEPLGNRDFFDMLELFASYQLGMAFYTNATLLNADRAERILRLGVDQLNVSIDGATAATFDRIRRHASFDQVIANVRTFSALRATLGRPQVKLQIAMVLMRENVDELPALIALAHSLGADSVYTMFVSNLVPEKMVQPEPVRTNRALREARRLAADLHLTLLAPGDLPETDADFDPNAKRYANDNGNGSTITNPDSPVALGDCACVLPWQQLIVWNDGDVSPCCHIRDDVDGARFGNIQDVADPTALWNSPGMTRLRERIVAHDLPTACRVCPLRTAGMVPSG